MEEILADLEIVERVKRGEQACFTKIVEKYHKPIFKAAYRIVKDSDLAQDIAQEAFMKAYLKIGTFEGRSQFKSWLYQIAINTAKNKLRRASRRSISFTKIEVSVGPKAELNLLDKDITCSIREEINNLPFKQKTALTLRIFEDMSFKQIAEVMKCPYDTAKANYRHGLLKLKNKFGESKEMKNYILEKDGQVQQIKFVAREAES